MYSHGLGIDIWDCNGKVDMAESLLRQELSQLEHPNIRETSPQVVGVVLSDYKKPRRVVREGRVALGRQLREVH